MSLFRIGLGLTALATVSLLTLPAFAAKNSRPDWEAEPLYKTFELNSGFDDDPRSIKIDAGGDRSAESIGGECGGFINWEKPDVDLNYENSKEPGSPAGDEKLTIYVESKKDTTLVIFTPDRKWVCGDDTTDANLNPYVTFDKPLAGNYNIWVGTYEEEESEEATVFITENYRE